MKDFTLIVALDTYRSMQKAASHLFISQPAISQRLKTIEHNWGRDLFVRTSAGLTPTPAGEVLIEYAKAQLQAEQTMKDQLAKMDNHVAGSLKIGVSSVIAQYVLPNILAKYMEEYPEVRIELQTGLSADLLRETPNRHLTIVRGDEPMVGMHVESWFSEPLALVYKNHDATAYDILTDLPFLSFQTEPSYHVNVRDAIVKQYGVWPERVLEVNNIGTCKALTLAGVGAAVLPACSVADLSDRCVVEPLKTSSRKTWLLYEKELTHLPQLRTFLQMLSV
ncbi:LysR-family transcriptional regulator CcpC [Geomicrobium sp. JCM 19037]|uniref:LysR family transcriptional regulator n=1 Tax=unclassified Geomicrobium TaxID=2628951 RepID=UPI00045F2CC0|nr:LysR family transcriptional regulator [Geomicrobium sp. JCM 19037]GAK02814.1 LysR-family transcriptional regulator CcpC [Geomicrobium sp. JCM 19037]